MARDDSWAQVLRAALPLLDGARPAGMLGWVPRVAPVVTQAAVGAGHWAAGRRRRALAAWTSAAGYGLVAWGLGTEAPTPAQARQNMQRQNIQRLQREGRLRKPGPKAPAAARTPTPAARRLERHLARAAPFFKATDTPQYRLASTAAGMVLGVWWGLRWPRRLTVLAIASGGYTVVFYVPWVARAMQRRRPRPSDSVGVGGCPLLSSRCPHPRPQVHSRLLLAATVVSLGSSDGSSCAPAPLS